MKQRGTGAERKTARLGKELGYLVSSLRHFGGAGDQLWTPSVDAITVRKGNTPLLIEVKATLDPPWRSTWGPDDRRAMLQAGKRYLAEPMLAWWVPYLNGGPIWLPAEDWPDA
jgi:Holliday junction resolvase